MLIAAGALVSLDSFARFALQGLGIPMPVFPTRHLVVSGHPFLCCLKPLVFAGNLESASMKENPITDKLDLKPGKLR